MNLPEAFLKRMENQLNDEYAEFIASYALPKLQGLRLNRLKGRKSPAVFSLEPIPWAEDGFYYAEGERPGKHPYFEAGVYYIQEPSAMAVVPCLAPQRGERILDLCAAPGGKTTQIASLMQNEGLLVTNEIHPARAKILSQNVERMGICNAVVTNETPEGLSKRFPAFFDRILVDAPCSGEGMFRKDPKACEEWSLENVEMCAKRQMDILSEAQKMLRVGGRLVYSTCTFSPEENEGTISRFLQQYPEFVLEQPTLQDSFSKGRAEFAAAPVKDIEKTIRIWPHRTRGEGHFIAVLKKQRGDESRALPAIRGEKRLPEGFEMFAKEVLKIPLSGCTLLFGENLYLAPEDMIDLRGLKVVRPGLHLGMFKKNRFEPSHALALALKPEQVTKTVSLTMEQAGAYLKGLTLSVAGEKGWNLVEVDGYSLGWGKWSDGILKNHYPKGLRGT